MSITNSDLFLMQCHLRAQRSRASILPFVSFVHRNASRFFKCFDDLMNCKWWETLSSQFSQFFLSAVCSAAVCFSSLHRMPFLTHPGLEPTASGLQGCGTSNLYFWEIQSFKNTFFIQSPLTDLLTINLISFKNALPAVYCSHHLL